MVIKLKEVFDFDLTIHKFLESPNIETLEKLILSEENLVEHAKSNHLYQDINQVLDIQIKDCNGCNDSIENIFLTGCTGFLGSHILSTLCKFDMVKNIYCLVRAKDLNQAREFIDNALKKHRLDSFSNAKIIPILGNLSLKNLGVSESNFIKLANKIDLIIHNGAYVNHILNYEALRSTNVSSVLELIRLAGMVKIKKLHFISTLSAACYHLDRNKIKESLIELDANIVPPKDGYSQSKWVSEMLLSRAKKMGIPIKVYRPWCGLLDKLKLELFQLPIIIFIC